MMNVAIGNLMSARKLDIIEYDDSTVVEIKINGQWYRYEFESWNDAIEAVPNLNPEED